jgi:hypothetical protein
MMRAVVSACLQHLHQASVGGAVNQAENTGMPAGESELVVLVVSRLLLLPRVMVQVLQLELKVLWELLNQSMWSPLPGQWLQERFRRILVQRLTLTMMGLLLRLRWLLAPLADEGMCVGCVARGLPRLVTWRRMLACTLVRSRSPAVSVARSSLGSPIWSSIASHTQGSGRLRVHSVGSHSNRRPIYEATSKQCTPPTGRSCVVSAAARLLLQRT